MARPVTARPQATRGALHASPLRAYIELLHLPPILVVLAAGAGFTIAAAQGDPAVDRLLLFLTALLLTQLAVSLHNDYCDRALDAVAKPWRALPSGIMSPRAALGWAAALVAAGLLAAAPLGWLVVLLFLVGNGSAFFYNAFLKRTAWSWAPFLVALPTLALCAFAVADNLAARLWLVYVIGAPLVLSVHIIDTLDDLESDRSLGVRGMAHRLGPGRARLLCWSALGLAQVLALILWPQGRPGPLFAVSVALLFAAIAADRAGVTRARWSLVMAAATILALGWLAALAE